MTVIEKQVHISRSDFFQVIILKSKHVNMTSDSCVIENKKLMKINIKLMKLRKIKTKFMESVCCKLRNYNICATFRSSHPVVSLGKCVLKICSKFTGEHPCQSTISIKLQSNFIEIAFRYWCSPVNLLHIFRTPFPKNTSGRLGLDIVILETIVILSKSFQCISSTNKDITKFYVRIRFLEYYFC